MKHKESKLDAHTERLDEWLTPAHEGGKGMTLDQAREQLRLDGCLVSRSRLGEWWSDRLTRKRENAMIRSIKSGADFREEVQAHIKKHGAPGMEPIIQMVQVLTQELSIKAHLDDEKLKPLSFIIKSLIDWEKEKGKDKDRKFAREKFEFDAAKACLKQLPLLKAISADRSLNDDQRIEQIRLKLFGEVPAAG